MFCHKTLAILVYLNYNYTVINSVYKYILA